MHNALYLRDVELDFLISHASQIEAEVVEEQKVAAPELVLRTRYIDFMVKLGKDGTYVWSR